MHCSHRLVTYLDSSHVTNMWGHTAPRRIKISYHRPRSSEQTSLDAQSLAMAANDCLDSSELLLTNSSAAVNSFNCQSHPTFDGSSSLPNAA